MDSLSTVIGILIVGIFLASGCVNPPSDNALVSPTTTDSALVIESQKTGPGTVILCTEKSMDENEECFEKAFASCEHVVGTFWSTSDGFPLTFESLGLTAEGKCRVRVTVLEDDETKTLFAGTSADCAIGKSPAMGEHAEPFFDAYLIGPSTCEGTYVDSIQTTAIEPQIIPDENENDESTSNESPIDSPPTPKEFSVTVNETGVVGVDTFTVKKGDTVHFTITVDIADVSFNGEQILAPAQKGLKADEYIFNSGHLKPGQSKTFEFVAKESFDFGVYWPGPSVLKGKGHFVVEGN